MKHAAGHATPSPASRPRWRRLLTGQSLRRRARTEALPIVLGRKRIYLLPTGFGIGFTLIELVMLLGALNYSNNAALLLTCLLAAVTGGSALSTFRNMDGLRLDGIRAGHATAGAPIHVHLDFAVAARSRQALHLDIGDQTLVVRVPGRGSHPVNLYLPTNQRGWMSMPALRMHTTWPFGMFRAWSWLRPDHRILVYPQPETAGPPPADGQASATASRPRQGDGDDLAGLRAYRPGDPRKHIAWKASARHENLLVREHERAMRRQAPVLDWQATRGLPHEQRIARLARWVVAAHAAGQRWSLRLPGQPLGTGTGSAHYHRCMRALALMPTTAV